MAGAEGLRVVRKERVDGAEEAVGAECAAEERENACGDFAKGPCQVDMGFTAKELAGLVELTVVGLEAGFENEADLVAVAEIFGTAKAEAGAEFLGVFRGSL